MNEQEIDNLIRRALADDRELPAGLSERLEQRIDRLTAGESTASSHTLPHRRYRLFLAGGVAAAMLAGAFLLFRLAMEPPAPKDTFTDPYRAALVAQDALTLMSEKLNKGLKPAADVGNEIDKVSRIFTDRLELLRKQ
ncbi:MAG: hypothetical protein LBL97_06765 [Prevotellaceae bacterium]|nr:hypothetical protein [Prevotellaceae bacterium]